MNNTLMPEAQMLLHFTPVIRSLLDTDFYKLTMLQAMLHTFPANQAQYALVCRSTPVYPLAELEADVNAQLDHLCSLQFTTEELDYLRTRPFFKPDFIDFLTIYRLQRQFIQVARVGKDLHIQAVGPQVHTMYFETFVTQIVNELYFRRFDKDALLNEARRRLNDKIEDLEARLGRSDSSGRSPFEFFDFGSRRRFSRAWHEEVVRTLNDRVPQWFRGTSNVDLARRFGLTPIGTMAHEWLQTFQAVGVQLRQSQQQALEAWAREYRGSLGIALTDVITMDAFLQDFDLFFAKLFDGLRHDSGCPVIWGEKALKHYERLNIDPRSKRLVFSDSLNLPKAVELWEHFSTRILTGFGLGTDLTNDTGVPALNLVMKLISCNGQPVAKISDAPGKTLCKDETFIAYLRQVFNVKEAQ